jgi:hypothetical protein
MFKKTQSTQNEFNAWISEMKGQLRVDLVAINFGLFETVKGFHVYLIGSNEYEDHNDDWACNEDFVPNQKHFGRRLKSKNWQEAISEVDGLINSFMESEQYPSSILDGIDYITCGFDDGDLKRIKMPHNNG